MILIYSLLVTLTTGWKMAHLTDIHWDPYYRVGSHAHCLIGDWLGSKCCRSFSIPKYNKEFQRKAGRWGDVNCDTNLELLNLTLASLSHLISRENISAVLYTGDSNSHLDYFQTPWTVSDRVDTVAELFQHYFRVPVYNSLGNHEAWPIDNLDDGEWGFLSETVRKAWSQSLSPNSLETLVKGGYYVEEIVSGLFLISLQTIWYDPYNFLEKLTHPFMKPENRANQSRWLRRTLQEIKQSGKRALIVGHAPPCSHEAGVFTEILRDIARDYQGTIIAGLFGHEHFDSFRWLDLSGGPATNSMDTITGLVTILTPSVVPEQNPRYRVFTFNDETFEIEEVVTYYLNLTRANEHPESEPIYEYLYSYREVYGLEKVTSTMIKGLLQRLESNSTLFDQYLWLRKTPDQPNHFDYDNPVLSC